MLSPKRALGLVVALREMVIHDAEEEEENVPSIMRICMSAEDS